MAAERSIPPVCAVAEESESPGISRRLMNAEHNQSELSPPDGILMLMVFRVSAGRMVGRDDELGRLLTLLDDAEAGRSVVALAGGAAGGAKPRLVAEVTQLAASRGFTVLSGQCAELGDSVPYLPLADALRGAAQARGVRDALSSRPALSRLLAAR